MWKCWLKLSKFWVKNWGENFTKILGNFKKIREILENFCKNLVAILENFCRNFGKLFTEILGKFYRNFERIYRNILKIIRKCWESSVKVLREFCRNSTENSLKFLENFVENFILTWISLPETFSRVKNQITLHRLCLGTAVGVAVIVTFLIAKS